MAQKGDITIETERGEIIDSIDVSIGEFTEVIFNNASEEDLNKTHCLQFIDPYGNTTFNMPQKQTLVSELISFREKLDFTEVREYLTPIINFLSKYKDAVHIYVKFHGD